MVIFHSVISKKLFKSNLQKFIYVIIYAYKCKAENHYDSTTRRKETIACRISTTKKEVICTTQKTASRNKVTKRHYV